MFKRQRTGSVVCPSCGKLVGVNDDRCLSCGRPNPGMWGFTKYLQRLGDDLGFVKLVMGTCGLLYLLSLLANPAGIRSGGGLSLLAPSLESLYRFGASGVYPVVVLGRWWTVLSAGWLHGGLLHILFNMLWVRQLAPATAALYGTGRMVVIYTLSSVAGFLLSALAPGLLGALAPIMGGAPFTVGASAAIFGLLGAMVYAGRRGVGAHLGRQAWSYAVVLFVFGLVVRGIDNWAHLGGFLGGYGLGRWLNPLKPEKTDHLLAGLICLAASAAAILVSLLSTFR